MHCPKCEKDTRIIDTRARKEINQRHRRHECLSCGFRFATKEVLMTWVDSEKIINTSLADIKKQLERIEKILGCESGECDELP